MPPEIWFRGATVRHEVKCFSVAQRRISTPISDTSLSAPYGPQAWDRGQVDACAQRIQRGPDLEAGVVGTPPPRGSGRVRRLIGGLAGRLECADLALDLVVAAADLRLVEVVALERLAKHEHMFGAVVPCERGGDLRLGGLAARVAPGGTCSTCDRRYFMSCKGNRCKAKDCECCGS